MKQDRHGLGSNSKKKPRITHFTACDISAVKDKNSRQRLRVPQQKWRKINIQKQKKDRKWEQNLRAYMNAE